MHARDLTADILVIIAYLCLVMFVGLRLGRKEENLNDFSLGNRSIPWWAVLASIIAAETSAATFLGLPGEGFSLVNFTYLQMILGMIAGRVIVAYLFIKIYYDRNVYSIYEFLETRFGPVTRKVASATFLVTRVLASGARLYVAAIILAVGYTLFTGSSLTAQSQLAVYTSAIVFLTVVTTVYTCAGGIKAVVWTDLIQSAVMITGAVAAAATLVSKIPGSAEGIGDFLSAPSTNLTFITTGIKKELSATDNLKGILTTDYTIWAALIGTTFMTMATHGTDQDMVQRMLTAKDYKRSRVSLVLSGLADLPVAFIFIATGILLYLFYNKCPDPGLPARNNEVFAYFILKEMPQGLRGLLVAGIFATAMGSLSAALNALATSATRDFSKSGGEPGDDVKTARRWTVVFSVLMILVAGFTSFFVIEHPESRIIPIVLGIFGYTYGSLLGVFLLGVLSKTRGSDRGNLVAMFAGLTAVVACPWLAFPWRVMMGCLVTVSVGALFKTPPAK